MDQAVPVDHPICQLLQSNSIRLKQPIIIGIAGDSGSGKTRFSKGIRELLGKEVVKTIEMDGYHKENREQRKLSGRLPLDPEANRLTMLLDHLQNLKQGRSIQVPVYNHEKGDFDPPVEFVPSPIIIVEGLFALYPQFLPYMDFTLYVDPSREVKWLWKKKRDMIDRGHDVSALEKEMLARESAYKRWIDFQKTSATIVVKIFPSQIAGLARYEFIGHLSDECFKIELLVEPAKTPLPSLMLPFDLAMITDIATPPFLWASVPGKYWGRDILAIHLDGEVSQKTIFSLAKHIEAYTGRPLTDVEYVNSEQQEPVPTSRFAQLLITWRFLELVNQKLIEQQAL